MITREKINRLRMERMYFSRKAGVQEYLELFRDLQPGTNVYWNGFNQPPVLSFRAEFDDEEFNRRRQLERQLVKIRAGGGNLGWIMPDDLELFAGIYRKPIDCFSPGQQAVLSLIEREGPLNIQQMKAETGMLVKELTPILHQLQQAYLIYEDQNNAQMDRGWYRFGEIFPNLDLSRFSRESALETLLPRAIRRFVWADVPMLRSYFKLPKKDLSQALQRLEAQRRLCPLEGGYILAADQEVLENMELQKPEPMRFCYALHRNDPLYRALEPQLKELAARHSEGLEYDHEPLQYLLIDGSFAGATVGHFRNGPYDLNDVVLFDKAARDRREDILQAVRDVNFGHEVKRFDGVEVK